MPLAHFLVAHEFNSKCLIIDFRLLFTSVVSWWTHKYKFDGKPNHIAFQYVEHNGHDRADPDFGLNDARIFNLHTRIDQIKFEKNKKEKRRFIASVAILNKIEILCSLWATKSISFQWASDSNWSWLHKIISNLNKSFLFLQRCRRQIDVDCV